MKKKPVTFFFISSKIERDRCEMMSWSLVINDKDSFGTIWSFRRGAQSSEDSHPRYNSQNLHKPSTDVKLQEGKQYTT